MPTVTRQVCTQVMRQTANDWVNTITNRLTRHRRDQSVTKPAREDSRFGCGAVPVTNAYGTNPNGWRRIRWLLTASSRWRT